MKPHIVIVGAGVIGLATAHALARDGCRVTVLERGPLGRESSWAGAGILSALMPWDYGPAVTQLIDYSLSLWPEWAATIQDRTGIDPEYVRSGMLVLPPDPSPAASAWLDAAGWSRAPPPPRITRAVPGGEDGLWLPHVAQVRNPRLLQGLIGLVRDQGVRLLEHQGEIRLRPEASPDAPTGNTIAVAGKRGDIACDRLVLCAGAWSGGVLSGMPGRPEIRPVKGQMLLFRDRPGRLPCVVYRRPHYLVPRLDGHILAGSTLEDCGFDTTPTEQARRELLAFVHATLPWLANSPPVAHWAGLRPGSAGNIPSLGRHAASSQLYINAGHFRYGVTMAPASAEIIAALISQRPPPLDISAYAPPRA